jgi:hypothetical protein
MSAPYRGRPANCASHGDLAFVRAGADELLEYDASSEPREVA